MEGVLAVYTRYSALAIDTLVELTKTKYSSSFSVYEIRFPGNGDFSSKRQSAASAPLPFKMASRALSRP
jgi:hypothetical protein